MAATKQEVLQTLRSDNLVLSSNREVCSGFKGNGYGRFKFVQWTRGNRYKDHSALCKCPSQNAWGKCMLMVPSDNTDIVALAVGLLQKFNDRAFIVNENASYTEHYKPSDFEIDIESTSALFGLNSFTGNDYVS